MPHRHPLQDCDLISNLSQPLSASDSCRAHGSYFGLYHMLPARHHSLVDNFGSIVSTGVYVHTLLHHRVAPCAQSLPSLVSAGLDLGQLSGHCGRRWGDRRKAIRSIKAIGFNGYGQSPRVDSGVRLGIRVTVGRSGGKSWRRRCKGRLGKRAWFGGNRVGWEVML